jgi:hypothetical protein
MSFLEALVSIVKSSTTTRFKQRGCFRGAEAAGEVVGEEEPLEGEEELLEEELLEGEEELPGEEPRGREVRGEEGRLGIPTDAGGRRRTRPM